MKRVLITGGAGQLAEAIRRTWTDAALLIPLESVLDLGDEGSIHRMVEEYRPDVVVNAGAMTNVDRCESELELATRINGQAVGWLAHACGRTGALLVQISTDYVFDGTLMRPYLESDPVAPINAYGRSKLLGEMKAGEAPDHLILRTAWLYDAWGKNFYRTMLGAAHQGRSLRVVDDQRGAPTSCRALARQIRVAVNERWRGLVHCTCQGEVSWHGFASEIFRLAGVEADLAPCRTEDYPLPAPRPAFSVLDGGLRAHLGSDIMPDWETALQEVVNETRLL